MVNAGMAFASFAARSYFIILTAFPIVRFFDEPCSLFLDDDLFPKRWKASPDYQVNTESKTNQKTFLEKAFGLFHSFRG
jgi:hypothetical protein